jgi:hypothetical protein
MFLLKYHLYDLSNSADFMLWLQAKHWGKVMEVASIASSW